MLGGRLHALIQLSLIDARSTVRRRRRRVSAPSLQDRRPVRPSVVPGCLLAAPAVTRRCIVGSLDRSLAPWDRPPTHSAVLYQNDNDGR